MSLNASNDQLAALDLAIRHAADERDSLVQLLTQLQAQTSIIPQRRAAPGNVSITHAYAYPYNLENYNGYRGINAHLLSN